MFGLDLGQDRPYRGCNITINLGSYVVPTDHDVCQVLGITEDQLDFARRPRLPDKIDGTYTSMYYHFGCIRVSDHVIASPASIRRLSIPWQQVSLKEEDLIEPLHVHQNRVEEVRSIPPKGVVTTMTIMRTIQNLGTEYIQVHHCEQRNTKILQYKYGANDAFPLLNRVQHLMAHSDSSFSVGNIRLRDVLFGKR